MLCPLKSVTTHDRGAGKDIDIVSLDILIDHLQRTHSPDGFGLSQLAKQASHIGAVEVLNLVTDPFSCMAHISSC